ncbi:S-adenosyl-L-methionine-dependent methyltransferase [Trametes punicea]|nr:S-adenosyl-L-methionine-dependent methyltransferase [Trametes punicea]
MKRHNDVPHEDGIASPKKARAISDHIHRQKLRARVYVEIPERNVARPSVAAAYEPVGDEATEDAEVQVIGETTPEEDDGAVPVRTLDQWAAFDSETREFIAFDQLLAWEDEGSHKWVAAGIVGAFVDLEKDEDDEDSDDDTFNAPRTRSELSDDIEGDSAKAQRIRLSTILECDAHFVTKEDDGWVVDRKIYLRTKFAWYILLRPSTSYTRFYRAAWKRHRLINMLFSALNEDTDASVSDVLRACNTPPPADDPLRSVFEDLAESAEEADLTTDDTVSYLTFACDKLHGQCRAFHRKLITTKLIRRLYPDLSKRVPPSSSLRKHGRLPRDPEKRILQQRNPTCVTPRVNAVAQKLFAQAMRVAELPLVRDETLLDVRARKVHHTDPLLMEWDLQSMCAPGYYSRVVIDGETYSVGDIVIVEPGDDQDRARARNACSQQARCHDNVLADTKWFCSISYMFEQRDKDGTMRKMFHARWLQHGSQTLLQEAAHARGLFWLNACDHLPLECIYSRCNVVDWPCGEPVPLEDLPGEPNRFFVGLTWDSENCSLIETPPDEIGKALTKCKPCQPCVSCGLAALEEERDCWVTLSSTAVSWNGAEYHPHDFVYLHTPCKMIGLLDIAQILRFISDDTGNISEAEVQHYGRYDAVVAQHAGKGVPLPRDNRRLFQMSVITKVPLKNITGKLYVANLFSAWEKEAFVQRDDHFYCDLQSKSSRPHSLDDLEVLQPGSAQMQCGLCMSSETDAELENERLLKKFGPLRALELFAGAGGLSTGLEMSGFVQTKWAVEFSSSAARTFRANHPHAIVYNQCSNKLLEHAIHTAKGLSPKPLRSLDGAECMELPPMPQPGEVDFIYGGPPCQSFSLMNHHRDPNDIRSTLVCNMISYVEFYRPSYFLLENVVGMLSYKLCAKGENSHTIGTIKMGVVKFILSSLTTLGYQVHFKVLQAGQYGAPQGRRRVIFWGACRGVPLPAFPLPQYAYASMVHNVNLPTGEVLHPITRQVSDGITHQCAPLSPVTVKEAINDLPRFDWMNPHVQKSATKEDIKERRQRRTQGIQQYEACSSSAGGHLPGYAGAVAYAQPPLSRYQSWLRAESGEAVLYHYTGWWSPSVVERVVNIPLRPDAGFKDLPIELRVKRYYDKTDNLKDKYQSYGGVYGRINGDGQFVTAMTTVAPNAKGGKVLHPDQKRILTIRECARAQGFPDKYMFLSVNRRASDILADQLRQIGNAVPVPLALALGMQIGKALADLRRYQEKQENLERTQSPEVDFD